MRHAGAGFFGTIVIRPLRRESGNDIGVVLSDEAGINKAIRASPSIRVSPAQKSEATWVGLAVSNPESP
jgi:hypothetical protein